jgi:transposase InsO family protein
MMSYKELLREDKSLLSPSNIISTIWIQALQSSSDPEYMEDVDLQKPSYSEPPLRTQSASLTDEQQAELESVLQDFSEVLTTNIPPGLPPRRKGDYPVIPLVEGAQPQHKPAFKLSPPEIEALKEQLKEYLDKGWIVPSDSPWGAPVFLVKKPHSTKLRLVCDWRALNKLTIRNRWAIPHPEQLMDQLSGAKFFTKLDLTQGYHQVRLVDDDSDKSTICTRFGSFKWLVLPFGLCNAPSVYSRIMGDILFEYQNKFVINFLDDTLIYSKTFAEHVAHIRMVLEKLRQNRMFANPEKCQWMQTATSYLGFEISDQGIACSLEKVQAITEWPAPNSVKGVRQFVGMCSFYRKHIRKFAHIAHPLHLLLRKDNFWNQSSWSPACQRAFDSLKKALTEAPVLAWPDFSKPFVIVPDSSGFAIGGVLAQDQGNGLQPVAYESRKMNKAEVNYPVHEQELLAILHCCKKWRHYLIGSPVDVHTDHAPLRYLHTQPNLSARQQRWLDFLAEYDLQISPQPGKQNVVVDAISRRPDLIGHISQRWNIFHHDSIYNVQVISSPSLSHAVDETFSPSGIPQLYQDLGSQHIIANVTTKVSLAHNLILETLQAQYAEDEVYQRLLQGEQIKVSSGEYVLINNIIYFRTNDSAFTLYIPAHVKLPHHSETLRETILSEAHELPLSGHMGTAKTLHRVQRQFYWPGLHIEVADWVGTCHKCQANKPLNRKPLGILQPLPIPFRRWETISADFITQLPESDGYDAILVVVDKLTKRAHFIPTTTDVNASQVAHLFYNTIFRYHGLPQTIISDRDSKFTSHFWQTLWKLLGTSLAMSSAFSPQTDGQTERLNRTLEEMLRAYVSLDTKDWTKHLTAAEFAYNNAISDSTGYSPFFLDCGQDPVDPLFFLTAASRQFCAGSGMIQSVEEFISEQTKNLLAARNALLLAQRNQAIHYNLRHTRPSIKQDDLVWLSTQRGADIKHLTATGDLGGATKFKPRWIGPFKVISMIGQNACKLLLPHTLKIHPVIHVRYLKLHKTSTRFPNRENPLLFEDVPFDIHDGNVEYEVEQILAKRVVPRGKGFRTEYLIKWKRMPSHENSWEPLSHLTHCSEILEEFERSSTQQC